MFLPSSHLLIKQDFIQ